MTKIIPRCIVYLAETIFGENQNRWRTSWAILLLALIFASWTSCEKTEDKAVSADSSAVATPSATDNSYKLGSIIHFGRGGEAAGFQKGGWSGPESGFTWSIGSSAKLTISIPASDKPLNLRMRLAGLTKFPELTSQPVAVYVNKQKIADWDVVEAANFTAVIPIEIAKPGGELNIELNTPKAASPVSVGLNGDSRILGVCCYELAITPTE